MYVHMLRWADLTSEGSTSEGSTKFWQLDKIFLMLFETVTLALRDSDRRWMKYEGDGWLLLPGKLLPSYLPLARECHGLAQVWTFKFEGIFHSFIRLCCPPVERLAYLHLSLTRAQCPASETRLTRRSILGSDCMTLIVMLWLLSDCSLTALWLLSDCSISL